MMFDYSNYNNIIAGENLTILMSLYRSMISSQWETKWTEGLNS